MLVGDVFQGINEARKQLDYLAVKLEVLNEQGEYHLDEDMVADRIVQMMYELTNE